MSTRMKNLMVIPVGVFTTLVTLAFTSGGIVRDTKANNEAREELKDLQLNYASFKAEIVGSINVVNTKLDNLTDTVEEVGADVKEVLKSGK